MNCQRFEAIVNDLARQQIVEAHAREQALLHSAECEICAQRLKDERRLTFALNTLATDTQSSVIPIRIEEHLRQAFRSQTFSRTQKRIAGGYWIVAAAAILLIVFGVAAIGLRLAQPSEQKPNSLGIATPKVDQKNPASIAEAPKPASAPINESETSSQDAHLNPKAGPFHRHRSRRAVARKPATAPPANYKETEIATGFMPLGYFTQLNLEEGGQLVRVELSRSAMLSLGLPVNMERYGERVKADVLLGSDGLARAIRFVQ